MYENWEFESHKIQMHTCTTYWACQSNPNPPPRLPTPKIKQKMGDLFKPLVFLILAHVIHAHMAFPCMGKVSVKTD